jgi:hypothetical protein
MSDDQWLLRNVHKLTLSEIADRRGNPIDGGIHAYLDAEITRRTAQAQIDAARWMGWSVLAIALTSGLTAFFSYLNRQYPHIPH